MGVLSVVFCILKGPVTHELVQGPNPEGRKIDKPEGRIYDEMAELLKNRKAEFDHKAEYIISRNLLCKRACYPANMQRIYVSHTWALASNG